MSSFAKNNRRLTVYLFLAVLVSVGILAYAVTYFMADGASPAQADSANAGVKKSDTETVVPVELMAAAPGRISSFVGGTSNLRAPREVDVVAQTEGAIREVMVEEGDRVKEGQILCQLNDRELQIRLLSAQQKLAQAKLQSEKAQIRREKAQTQIDNSREEFERYRKLYDEKLVSEREVAQLRYRIDELLHDERVSSNETRELAHRVGELEAEISQVRLEIARTSVPAPFAGVITERAVETGQTVRNLDRLFKLANFSKLLAEVHLSERDARQVRTGQEAAVLLGLDEGQRAVGRVLRVSPVVDQTSGTVKVTVELDSAQATFKPGAFVRVEIETDAREGNILIPKRAILEEDGRRYVFVADQDQVKRVEVRLGYESGGQSEVLSGLSRGQKVVVAGQGALKEGSKIKTVEGQAKVEAPEA